MSSRAVPTEFLPGLLAIEARAPHPAARLVLILSLGLFVAVLAWVCFGEVDIVAIADGKLVPATHVKIVQPAEGGIAKEILVTEGQTVEAGQVLVRMDPALSDADRQAVGNEYEARRLALRRIDAQLAGRPLSRQRGDRESLFTEALAQYNANRAAYETQLAQERSALEKARHEQAAAAQVRDKLAQVLPHYVAQEAAYVGLGKEGFAGQLMVTDKVRERIEREQDLKTQLATIEAARAGIANAEQRMKQVTSDYERQLRTERAEVATQVERLRQELVKLDHRATHLELTAPQAGRIKDLVTHTPGTVVQPGTVLMTLVPANDRLIAEIHVSNSDAGFVREGQEARVKVAAYPFQRYGTIDGRVSRVGADAQDEASAAHAVADGGGASARGPARATYRARVDLEAQRSANSGRPFALTAGMQVSAEILLGQRTVLEYLLSPVQKAIQEAGRER